MEERVKKRLVELAASAKQLADSREWKRDWHWMSQFDWNPKKAGKSRGVVSCVFSFLFIIDLRCRMHDINP